MKAFFVRKEKKQHGLQRRVEGPLLEPGERCLIVEDVVTTGGSTVQAIEALREEGSRSCGVGRGPRPPGRRRRAHRARPPTARPTSRWRRSTTSTPTGPTGLAAGAAIAWSIASGASTASIDHDGGADDAGAVVERWSGRCGCAGGQRQQRR